MALKHFLENSDLSRKVFGEKELFIISKQLKGVDLTQSEKNRLSRDIRAKFKFISQVAKFSEEFELKKGIESQKKINNAVKEILESEWAIKIRKIYLFGSFAEGNFSIHSDIDLAIGFDKISKREATKFRAFILGRVPEKIDIQVFEVLPDKIKREILKKGKILYDNEK